MLIASCLLLKGRTGLYCVAFIPELEELCILPFLSYWIPGRAGRFVQTATIRYGTATDNFVFFDLLARRKSASVVRVLVLVPYSLVVWYCTCSSVRTVIMFSPNKQKEDSVWSYKYEYYLCRTVCLQYFFRSTTSLP